MLWVSLLHQYTPHIAHKKNIIIILCYLTVTCIKHTIVSLCMGISIPLPLLLTIVLQQATEYCGIFRAGVSRDRVNDKSTVSVCYCTYLEASSHICKYGLLEVCIRWNTQPKLEATRIYKLILLDYDPFASRVSSV